VTKLRVRIWNSGLANQIEGKLSTPWDRRIFRQMLVQNAICETELLNLFLLWHNQVDERTLCDFLINNGLLLVDTGITNSLNQPEIDTEHSELIVSLTPRARVELPRAGSLRYFLGRVKKAFLRTVSAELSAQSPSRAV
jgi:hypothetical protein